VRPDVFFWLLLKHLNQFLVCSRFHERRREESTAHRGAPNVRELYKYTHNIRKRHHAIKQASATAAAAAAAELTETLSSSATTATQTTPLQQELPVERQQQ